MPRLVEILAFPAVQLLDVAGPLQVFSSANERAEEIGMPMPYATRVIAPGGARVSASAGLEMLAEPLPETGPRVDTLIVAGGRGVMQAAMDAHLTGWVRTRAGTARRIASVCTGAFLLGAAGLLDNRRVVTHWEYCGRLAQNFPLARVDPDPIFIEDGQVWTSAGVTAGIDLSLALVQADLGRDLALKVARHLVVFLKRPGGQAQFSAALTLQSAGDRFTGLHEWMANNLAGDLSLTRLAAEAGMSERSFSRHYTQATGLTPTRAVECLRIEAARNLLSETQIAIKRIAAQCGFGTEETMRRSFIRSHGVSPQDYRARFSS